MVMKRIFKVIVFCSIVILLHGCFSSDTSSERACQDFGFDAYHTLEKTFGGLPLTITAHRRIADDFQCVSASYKGNTTVIDKSIRTPFGLNMILGNNIAGRPFLVVASSMGDEPDWHIWGGLHNPPFSQQRLMSIAVPVPAAPLVATIPVCSSRRFSSSINVPIMIAPVAPIG